MTGQKPARKRKGLRTCRAANRVGSIYTITLGSCLIVATLGFAALSRVRVHRHTVGSVSHAMNATTNAKTGLQMALYRIQTDQNWRQKLRNGTWDADQDISHLTGGTYRFSGSDPTDKDRLDNPFDSVLISATGKHQQAVQKYQAMVEFRQQGMRCLEVPLHTAGTITIDAATIRSDGSISSNQTITAGNAAQVHAKAEARISVTANRGSVFHRGTTSSGSWPRDLPRSQDVLQQYSTLGTVIDYASIGSPSGTNLIVDPGAETGSSAWIAYGPNCEIEIVSGEKRSGRNAVLVKNRQVPTDGVAQEITAALTNNADYESEIWVYSAKDDSYRILCDIEASGGDSTVQLSQWVSCREKRWTKVGGNGQIAWTGTLTKATWHVESQSEKDDFWIDDTSVSQIVTATIEKVVLSPSSNPYGLTNSNGIYVIDCGGEELLVRNVRIVGTLVVLNADPLTVTDSIHWAPAKTDWKPGNYNLPALVVSGDLRLHITDDELDESNLSTNFNPSGTPYMGSTDNRTNDDYPSRIHGLIYCTGTVEFDQHVTVHGVVVAGGNVGIQGTLELQYSPSYMEYNAPPGFADAVKPVIVRGSVKKVTN